MKISYICLFFFLTFSIQGETYYSMGKALFEKGYNQWSDNLLLEAQKRFDKAVEKAEEESDHAKLLKSVLYMYRINHAFHGYDHDRDKKKAGKLVKEALKSVEPLINGPYEAEARALKGALLGIKIELNPITAPLTGPKSGKELEAALKLDSENPRVLYLCGITYYKTPEFAGGGFKKTKPLLEKAAVNFSKENASGNRPLWGWSSSCAFLGDMHREKEDNESALFWYKEAFTINKLDHMARMGINKVR